MDTSSSADKGPVIEAPLKDMSIIITCTYTIVSTYYEVIRPRCTIKCM